jgi:CBS domain containing-hemolysin-like protein
MTTALGLAAVATLIAANGYFVAAEFAYVAVSRGRLELLAEDGDRRAARALEVTRRLSFMLSGAQFGITVSSLLVGFIVEAMLGRGIGFTLGFAAATATQMVIGELAPKNLGISRPEPIARSLAAVTLWYLRIAGPLVRLFDSSANRLVRLVGIQPVDELARGVGPDELAVIFGSAGERGALQPAQTELLERVLEFRNLRAADAMAPRTSVVSIPADATAEQLRRLAVETGHSRFPVVGDGLDDVTGVVQAKDVLGVPQDQRDRTPVSRLMTATLAVPESALLGPLLAAMRHAHTPLAIVVDEHGGTAGVVSLEDIVEELVGEIRDEHDRPEPTVHQLAAAAWRVPGSWRIDEVDRDTGMQLPTGDYDTVGGLVMAELGRVPHPGDEVRLPGCRMRVESMDGHAVAWVRLLAELDEEPAP